MDKVCKLKRFIKDHLENLSSVDSVCKATCCLLGILGSGISELLTGPVKCVSSDEKLSEKDKEAENEVKTEESNIDGKKRLCWCGK